MAKEVVWYEVYDITSNGLNDPKLNYFIDDFCELKKSELLGRYSTKENAVARLRKWAEQKGICFEDNVFTKADYTLTKIEVCVGIFYSLDDIPLKYTDDWAYGSQSVAIQKVMLLDEDV